MNAPWHLMKVRPKLEARQVELLAAAGIAAWTAEETVWKRRNIGEGRVKAIVCAMPGYLFFSFADRRPNWDKVFRAKHSYGVVMAGPERPSEACPKALAAFMASFDTKASRAYLRGGKQRRSLSIGDHVTITGGAWQDYCRSKTVRLESIGTDKLGRILLDIMGGSREVAISLDHLEAA